MDELIYILLAVAWIVYSIYSANQKKKQRQAEAAKNAGREEITEQTDPAKRQRSILEEMFEDSGFEEFEETGQEEAVLQQAKEDIKTVRVAEDEVIMDKASYLAMKETETNDEDEVMDVFDIYAIQPLVTPESFDLKKAIIYSAIIERPYQ